LFLSKTQQLFVDYGMKKGSQTSVRLLVGGPPGSGKTYCGRAMENRFGWTHFDCEQFHVDVDAKTFADFLCNPFAFVPNNSLVVATWGFLPQFGSTIKRLVDGGFQPVWLQGDETQLDAALYRRSLTDPSAIATMTDVLRSVVQEAKKTLTSWYEVDVFLGEDDRRDVAALLHEQFAQ
jgi:hypothetical protein